jgi:hypothetical protein
LLQIVQRAAEDIEAGEARALHEAGTCKTKWCNVQPNMSALTSSICSIISRCIHVARKGFNHIHKEIPTTNNNGYGYGYGYGKGQSSPSSSDYDDYVQGKVLKRGGLA